MGLCRLALITVPEGFSKSWLATPEAQLKPFAVELTIYCNRHGIDPSEYIGDFFPLVITGLPIAFGILHRHKEHKKEHSTIEKQLRSGTRKPEEPEEKEPEHETEEETET